MIIVNFSMGGDAGLMGQKDATPFLPARIEALTSLKSTGPFFDDGAESDRSGDVSRANGGVRW